MEFNYKAIGYVHSPHQEAHGTPIQTGAAKDVEAEIELLPEYRDGLMDLEGFSHIILLYHCHKAGKTELLRKPFMDNKKHGIFAIRAPSRPNPIGLSIVRLVAIKDHILRIKDVDILDGTPILDIKPYVPEFDTKEVTKIGWLEKNVHKMAEERDDGRFLHKKDGEDDKKE